MKIFRWLSGKKPVAPHKEEEAQPEDSLVQKKAKAESIKKQRKKKLDRVRPFLRSEPLDQTDTGALDFLSPEIREKFGVIDTDNVSAHGYDRFARELIDKYSDGLVLDCGSGLRSDYLGNVVNYEIVPYLTTDVIGVAEELPFKDETFDAVLSLNVLEHLKNPFSAASEISRVLKKNGQLFCVVPLLQPVHGYPSHYYNMTAEGLKNLFTPMLKIDKQEIIASGLPVFALTWMISSWANGLQGKIREDFLNMPLKEFLVQPEQLINRPFVKSLGREKNFELASTTALWGTKE